MSQVTKEVLMEVYAERERQHAKWGEQNHPNGTAYPNAETAISMADSARRHCDMAFRHGGGTWRHILDEEIYEAYAEVDPVKLREELVQVAAVTVAWIEAIDREQERTRQE